MIELSRRRRRRRGRRGRFPKPVTIPNLPKINRLVPEPSVSSQPVVIDHAEIEALRLVDLEGLSQEAAGIEMGVSRGTIWRFLQSARRKVAQALTEGRPLTVSTETNQTSGG